MQEIIVIGGGLSGLSTAYLLQQKAKAQNIAISVKVLEKAERSGGKIWSRSEEGFLCEWGPNGFLTNKPQTLELCKQLGVDSKLLASNDNARKRFVVSDGVLHKLPHNQVEFLTNSLISWRGKLRIAGEFFVGKKETQSDETLANFTRRRLGDEALRKLIGPMASGIFAGDPEQMSLQACFPRINQLEQEYGGLLKAMLLLMRKHHREQKAGNVVSSPAGPGGVLTSFANGIEELTHALVNAIGAENILTTMGVDEINQVNEKWQIITQDKIFIADKIVCATPAYATAKMLHRQDIELSNELNKITYSPLVVACLGYDQKQIAADLNGFGYLFAQGEDDLVLGSLWDSSIFANRAPDGKVLFRSMLGGALHPDVLELSDAQLQAKLESSLVPLMKIHGKPELVQIYRHKKAIPHYRLGHLQLVNNIMNLSKQHNGLFITGNAYFGVGINDCVAASDKCAQNILVSLI